MSYLEAIGLVGTMATILGVFLTLYGIFNNRTLKRESRETREMIKEESKATRDILVKMEQGQEAQAKAARDILERIGRGQEEARKEMARALERLSQLTVQEGERTRQAITAKT